MTEVIGVRFRGGVKEYYFDPRGTEVEAGRFVIVETAQGTEYAQCVTGNHEVEDSAVVRPLRALVRLATENDRRTYEYNKGREKEAFRVAQKKIEEHGLDMKLVRVESNFEGSKIIFFFTSDGRVDFRELVRDLAGVFRARIELRQIGVRDEAKMLGGIGICGRPFCCAQFLDDFIPVSIKMAKTQNLSLNPTKISGACGRLMCCLKYEQDAYEDAVRHCPRQESFVLTPDGAGNVSNVDLLREQVVVRLDDSNDGPKRYHNSEIRVLRNGKGSREGIEIPEELPERWEDPEKETLPPEEPSFRFLLSEEDEAAREEHSEQKRSRGHRGGRRRGSRSRGEGGKAQEAEARPDAASPAAQKKPPEGKKKPQNPPRENRGEKRPQSGEGGEKAAARRSHHRGGRGHRRSGEGGASGASGAEG